MPFSFSGICGRMAGGGYAPGRSGNISCREGDYIRITPRGFSLAEVEEEHIVTVWPDGGHQQKDGLKPSGELAMHQIIYKLRPDVGGVIHAHPPKATALAMAGHPLDAARMPDLLATLGRVPLIGYFPSGSRELAQAVGEVIRTHNALLLANHGVVVTGPTLKDAWFHLQVLESCAEICLHAQALGGIQPLPSET